MSSIFSISSAPRAEDGVGDVAGAEASAAGGPAGAGPQWASAAVAFAAAGGAGGPPGPPPPREAPLRRHTLFLSFVDNQGDLPPATMAALNKFAGTYTFPVDAGLGSGDWAVARSALLGIVGKRDQRPEDPRTGGSSRDQAPKTGGSTQDQACKRSGDLLPLGGGDKRPRMDHFASGLQASVFWMADAAYQGQATSQGKYLESLWVSEHTQLQGSLCRLESNFRGWAADQWGLDGDIPEIAEALSASSDPTTARAAQWLEHLIAARERVLLLYNATMLVYRTPGADVTTLIQIQFRDQYERARAIAEPHSTPLNTWEEKKVAAMEQLGQKAAGVSAPDVPICPAIVSTPKGKAAHGGPATPPTVPRAQQGAGRGEGQVKQGGGHYKRQAAAGGGGDRGKKWFKKKGAAKAAGSC